MWIREMTSCNENSTTNQKLSQKTATTLHRQKEAKPKSHGNYNRALESVLSMIRTELENAGLEPGKKLDEIPDLSSYAIVFLSDGKPSDKTDYDSLNRQRLVENLFEIVPASCVSFHAIGLGNSTQHEFGELEAMVNIVKARGGQGTFTFSQASSCAMLSEAFSTVSQSTTATRTEMLAGADGQSSNVKMKDVQLRKRYIPSSERRFNRFTNEVTRWKYDHEAYKASKLPWKQVGFKNSTAVAFDMEVDPFGKGAERLAYMFHEIDSSFKRLGTSMVAKESIRIHDEGRKMKFHEHFCRVQRKARELSIQFNRAVARCPALKPVEGSTMRTPNIEFLDCFVYEYRSNDDGQLCGVLVEKYLKGKSRKYNSNGGYVMPTLSRSPTIELQGGVIAHYTDFVQAFSHWVYFTTDQRLLICDLQGVLNEEGRHPKFELTDPCICSRGLRRWERFGRTDTGMRGIRLFRMSHVCNNVCNKGLGLPAFGSRQRIPR